jgi:hypothetical protein
MNKRNTIDKAAFLYAAITQDYKPQDKTVEKKRDNTNTHISHEEYITLPEAAKVNYTKVEHQKPGSSSYRLSSMPSRILVAERFAFNHLKIGDEIDEHSFSKLSPKTKDHFEQINTQPQTISMYHAKNS